jgi:hypothetical protein
MSSAADLSFELWLMKIMLCWYRLSLPPTEVMHSVYNIHTTTKSGPWRTAYVPFEDGQEATDALEPARSAPDHRR